MPFAPRALPLLLGLLCFLAPLPCGADGHGHADPDLPVWTDAATGMEFVRLPGGCFLMGSPLGEDGREPDEERRHVCVEPFWMARHEVTRAQYRAFVEATGHVTHAERQGWIRAWNHRWMNVYGKDWRDPDFEQGEDHPVLALSWEDAAAFAEWMSRRAPGTFRLPSEAEWEYAARAGTAAARWWGEEYDERVCAHANVGDLTNLIGYGKLRENPTPAAPCEDGFVFSAPVGSFAPNPFGLHDMLGNAQEWCAEAHPDEPEQGHMTRGGSFLSITADVRAAAREWVSHDYGVYFTLGFRLARDE